MPRARPLTIGRPGQSPALVATLASNPNTGPAAQRLQQAGGLPHSGSKGLLFTDNGQEHVQALDYQLASCAPPWWPGGELARLRPARRPHAPCPPLRRRWGGRAAGRDAHPLPHAAGRAAAAVSGGAAARAAAAGETGSAASRPGLLRCRGKQAVAGSALSRAAASPGRHPPLGCPAPSYRLFRPCATSSAPHAVPRTVPAAGPRPSWQTTTTAAALVRDRAVHRLKAAGSAAAPLPPRLLHAPAHKCMQRRPLPRPCAVSDADRVCLQSIKFAHAKSAGSRSRVRAAAVGKGCASCALAARGAPPAASPCG